MAPPATHPNRTHPDRTDRDRPSGRADGLVDASAGRAAAPAFALASLLRRRGIVHPVGVQHRAEVVLDGPGLLAGTPLGAPRRLEAVTRLSRSAGTPEPAPDALGLAVRLLDVDGDGGAQDLLLLTSSPSVAARHVILPARGFGTGFYTSILPFRAAGDLVLVGARPVWSGPAATLARFEELTVALRSGRLHFELLSACPAGGWRRLGVLRTGEQLPDDAPRLHFSPYTDAGGLAPVGPLNVLRRRAYLGSQSARTG